MSKKLLPVACILFLALFAAQRASAASGSFENTEFYKTVASTCAALDKSKWSASVLRVFKRAKAQLKVVQTCKASSYRIFTGVFNWDPNGPNDTYYNGVYADLARANHNNSYAIVDPSWGAITTVSVNKRGELSIDREDFSPAM